MSEPPVLHVQGIGVTTAEDGEQLPTVVVDASKHPEVRDLARVHATDGVGEISTEALCLPWGEGHLFLLGIRVSVPVLCTFAVGFSLPAQRQVLDDAVLAGRLVIATTDPTRAADEKPLWLAVDLDPQDLKAALP